jgi:DNA polymerase-3 subunit alpha
VDRDRGPEFIDNTRNNGYGIIPPDINRSRSQFTAEGTDVIYGLSMVKGIGEAAAEQVVKYAPYSSYEDFVARCVKFTGSAVNMGSVRTLVEVGAFDSLISNRRALEQQLAMEATGEARRCVFKIEQPNPAHPHNLPCSFDWANEPDPPMLPRGRGKNKVMVAKEPPKACNVKCRQYLAPEPIKATDLLPYSSEEIMRRERELLGVWITHSPFESIPRDVLDDTDQVKTAQQIEAGPAGTEWQGIGLVEEVKKRKDKNGNDYAFVKINMQDGEIEAICFASVWAEVGQYITKDRLCLVVIRKTPKGYQLPYFEPIN